MQATAHLNANNLTYCLSLSLPVLDPLRAEPSMTGCAEDLCHSCLALVDCTSKCATACVSMAVATGSSARPQVLTAGQQDRGTAGQQCFAHVVPLDYQCAAAWVVVQLLQVAAAAAAAAVQSAGMAAAVVVTMAAVVQQTLMMKAAMDGASTAVVPMDHHCAAACVVLLLQVAAAAAAAAVQSAGMAAAGVVTRQVAAVALETLMMKPAASADAAMGMSHKMEEIDLTERVADSAAQVVGRKQVG